MNIAVNARFLLPGPMEGMSRFIWETLRRMIVQHPEDRFYLFFDRPHDPSFIIAENVIPIEVIPPARHPILWHIWFEWRLPRQFRKYSIDVFYSGDGFLSLSAKTPTLLVTHDLAYVHFPQFQKKEHLPFLRKYIPKYNHRADHIIAVSQFTKDDIVNSFALDAKKITVAYNALPEIPDSESSERLVSEDYFLYLGAIHPRKNILRLVQAYEKFRQSNPSSQHKLILAGRMAWLNQALESTIAQSHYQQDIVLYGMVSELEKHNLYQHATALVYISLFEGFGIPVLEAMHHETPVITSQRSSMSEIAGNAALFIDPLDIEQIAQAMTTICTDNKLREELTNQGKQQLNNFNWDHSAQIIYQELCNLNP